MGKTSLVRQFVEGRFDDRYLSTIGVKISRRTVARAEYQLKMLIWDLAGGEDYNDVTSGYLRGAAAVLLVCDLTRPLTLLTLKKYVDQLADINLQPALVVAGNKVDLIEERALTADQLAEFAAEIGASYLLTSAKSGAGVAEAFDLLAEAIETK